MVTNHEVEDEGGRTPESMILSDAEMELIVKIETREPLTPSDLALLPRLHRLHLIEDDHYRPGRMVIADPVQAELQLRQDLQGLISGAVADLGAVPALMAQLRESGHRALLEEVGIDWIEGVDKVNTEVARARQSAQIRVFAAQPGTRSPELLRRAEISAPQVLQGGVEFLTLYPDSARQLEHQREFVAKMSLEGSQFRTTKEIFLKSVIFDRSAVVPDLLGKKPADRGGWHIRHPAVVALLAELFMLQWERSRPWNGETDTNAYLHTTELQRKILHLMAREDLDQTQVSNRLGYSNALINKSLSALRKQLNINTVPRLLYWWATTEDNRFK